MAKKTDSELKDIGVHYLTGDVDEDNCKEAVEFILECNLLKKREIKQINLLINSHGGYLHDAFGLVDAIETSSIRVRTVGLGYVGSAALYVFMTGHERVCTPNTVFLSHQYTSEVSSKEHDLVAMQKETSLVSKIVLGHYTKHTGLTEAKVKSRLLPPSDVYLDAQEAKSYGIVDRIIRRLPR